MTDTIVRFAAIGKTYDGVTRVVDDLDLDIERGEFLTLLGPSGSGKTTTLMMLAGFETPTSGQILLDGRPLAHLPPYKRQIGMVFQNYALFPHMTVAENIAFPLSVRGVAPAETAIALLLDMPFMLSPRKDIAGSFGMVPTTPHRQEATSQEGRGANGNRRRMPPENQPAKASCHRSRGGVRLPPCHRVGRGR